MKLHLGCGNVRIPNYCNIDIQPTTAAELIFDVRKLPFVKNSVDEIYACHVLEHFTRNEWYDIIKHWYEILKPNGVLRIAVPDFEAVCKEYIENGVLENLFGLVIGGQRNSYDQHGMIFDFKYLEPRLRTIGFRKVERYDWKTTEHAEIDDYSQAYLPHLQKDTGRPMSLNIKATK